MYMNGFSVRVPEGNERGGYVELRHGIQYTLVLRNSLNERCDAEVSIDGKSIGTFRIMGRSSIRLERPPNDNGRFTFYRYRSQEASGLPDVSMAMRGLVSIVFTPEKKAAPQLYIPVTEIKWDIPKIRDTCSYSYRNSSLIGDSPVTTMTSGRLESGITGLSGKSEQGFVNVGALVYDYSQQTIINLRLAAKEEGGDPRPLTAYSSPIPPPIV